MFPKIRIPWWSSRRTSPTNARQSITSDSSLVSISEGPSTIQAARFSESRQIDTHQGPISSVHFLPGVKHIVTGGHNGTIRWWKIEEGGDHASEMGQPIHSEEEMCAAVVSKDGKWLILAETGGRKVTVWDTSTRKRVVESSEPHEEKITALDVSPDASKIASGSRDGTVIVWCLKTGRRIAGPFSQGRSVLAVKFSPTGDHLASAAPDYLIHFWIIYSDNRLSPTHVLTDPACSLAWSNDGRSLFAGCQGGKIRCFDISCSKQTKTNWCLPPHIDSVSTLRLSNNGKFIISASRSECLVKIWDVHTQSEICSLEHTSEVLDAEISADDGYVLSGTKDGKISIWDLRNVLRLPMPYFFHSLTTRLIPSSCSDTHPILMEISSAAYVSWRNAELAEAEAILSSEIERNSGPLHYHFASRALVRARLQQWDGASDDAQAAIDISPSLLIALIAKSVAQSGHKMYDTAMETLDNALEICDLVEKDFVNAIKAIALFDAGHSDEAIRLVNDLVVRSPDIKQPCAFIQARMYDFLGEDATNSQQYDAAMSLFAQARDLCPSDPCPELATLSLISGCVFDGLRHTIYRKSCEACYAAGHAQEILDSIRQMESTFKDEINLRSELNGWLTDFKSRSTEMLKSQGDRAMCGENYESAIALYSMALTIAPAALEAALFVKRSEARIASCLWEDALKDAEEAIRLSPSSPWGYERKHAALHKLARYGDAIDASKTMISILENSSDAEIRQLRGNYVDPSDTKKAILEVFGNSIRNSPFRLLDTTSGRLCDAEKRRAIFAEDPVFRELVSSMTNELHQERIDTITRRYSQYVMLSHRWGTEEFELADVLDKSIYDLETSPSATKLQRYCHLARDAEFRWAWSDTCCIDKNKDVEFARSINSMFRWYRSSAATIVYLPDVPPQLIPGTLKGSVWMKRGWTLQELLAPPVIRFYYNDWTPYLNDTSINHKESTAIMQELEDATDVKKHDLLTFHPGLEDIRVKLRLASTRETKFEEDMAYGLFGIFGVTMPVIHGESGENALGRLFQEIVARSGDVTCITWVGQSSEFNSAFPKYIRVYEHPPRTVPQIGEEDMERQVADLQRAWTREDEAQAMAFYHRLQTLSPARCMSQHLHLPCIVFRLTALNKVKRTDGAWVHCATANALEDTEINTEEINTEERLLSKNHGPQDLILVCPWVYELLDDIPRCHNRHHHPSGDGESPPDSDSHPKADHDTSARESDFDSRGRTVSSPSDSDSPLLRNPLPDQREIALKALKLEVRFKQPLGALLLLAQGHGQYKRVATNTEITIRVREEVSLGDMDLQTLDIV